MNDTQINWNQIKTEIIAETKDILQEERNFCLKSNTDKNLLKSCPHLLGLTFENSKQSNDYTSPFFVSPQKTLPPDP